MENLLTMKKQFYIQTLPQKTAELMKDFKQAKPSFLENFYLSGGTALSLQIGHRETVDLDFFSQKDFNPELLQAKLEKFGKLNNLELDENTLNAFLKNVQIQFLGYPYSLLKPTVNWEGIRISSVIDIACTKLQTISVRGNKKDFIDLYFILKEYSLEKLFRNLDKKYKDSDFNKIHILKSLVYFIDANSQPMPRMHKSITWEEVKKSIANKVTNLKL